MPRLGKCASCKNVTTVSGRSLCKLCYKYHRNHHSLERFPRSTWKREDLMDEWNLCRRRGLSVREAAEKIGVTQTALRKAIERTRSLAQ